ncbi:MAG: tripartite tricarboxylate transporter permease [Candidatus Aenigmarchaeota archaeon]|nr:tripartite tricarboxylate transporter permease [Candidatus Aenigmarchaeota archaeon]
MFFTIFYFVLIGFFLGIFTGLVPGIHPNAVALLVSSMFIENPFLTSVLILSMAVTHTFLDFIPSMVMGVPDPDTALSVLPGHRLLLEGAGYEALYLTVIGGIVSMIIIILLLPPLAFSLGSVFWIIEKNIQWILIAIVTFMFLKDRNVRSILIFLASGIIGLMTINGNVFGNNVLFPMLTGMFGVSSIVYSLFKNVKIPAQSISTGIFEGKKLLFGGLVGTLSGILVGLLPGVGAAQATFLSQQVLRSKSERGFLVAIGGVNTTVAIMSIVSLFLVGKTRTGVGKIISEITEMNMTNMLIMLAVIIFVVGIASVSTLYLGRIIYRNIDKISYRKMNFFTLIVLSALVLYLNGGYGLLLMVVSGFIGLTTILLGVRRSYLMGCLILPTILFFL